MDAARRHRIFPSWLLRLVLLAGGLWLALLAVFGLTFGVVFAGLLMLGCTGLAASRSLQGRYPWLRRARHVAYGLILLWLASLLAVSCLIFGTRSQSPPPDATLMIVLGAGLRNGDQLSTVLRSRLDTALDVAHRHPRLRIVVSGGQGNDETLPEARAMQSYLLAHGVAPARILLEERSTTTEENLRFSLRLLRGQPGTGGIVLLTSDFHLYRAQKLAARQGLRTTGIAAPTPTWVLINYALREYFALIKAALLAADAPAGR